MTELAQWLRAATDTRGYTQIQAAVHTGVSQGTISDIVKKDHIPRMHTLFSLADHLGTGRVEILMIAGHIRPADELPAWKGPPEDDDRLTWQLLQEFRRIPDPYKPDAIGQVALIARLTKRPAVKIIGDESEDTPDQAEPPSAEQEQEQPRARAPSKQVKAEVA
jgi:transcriptional regulator with XRE-family HTH domain